MNKIDPFLEFQRSIEAMSEPLGMFLVRWEHCSDKNAPYLMGALGGVTAQGHRNERTVELTFDSHEELTTERIETVVAAIRAQHGYLSDPQLNCETMKSIGSPSLRSIVRVVESTIHRVTMSFWILVR